MATKCIWLILHLLLSKQEATGSYCSRTLKEEDVHRLKMVSVYYWRMKRLFIYLRFLVHLWPFCWLLSVFCSSFSSFTSLLILVESVEIDTGISTWKTSEFCPTSCQSKVSCGTSLINIFTFWNKEDMKCQV